MKKINIRRFLLVSLLVLTVSAVIIPSIAFAVKPKNLAGAEKVPWNLSAAVMPAIPCGPYGSGDIPGSDTASKLIVNQPNGNIEVAITGDMHGLDANKTYTVFLANGYEPYVFTGWNVSGDYVINVNHLGTNYAEDLVLLQSDGNITGVSIELVGGGSRWTITDGSVNGNNIDFYGYFDPSPGLEVHIWGTIACDGSMSGSWADVAPGTRTGTWASISGNAIKTHTGDDWFTGYFNEAEVPKFTFMTDEYGAGSWHINLRDDDFYGPDTYSLSVWINNGTILISDVFEVTVE